MFTDRHLQTLRAAVDCIIPPDAETPGGVETGAVEYLLKQFDGDLASEVENYKAFLETLESASIGAYSEPFASLSPDARTELLRQAETSETQRRFFRRFVEQAQEGFYISPVAWGMIGWKVRG